MPASSEQVPLLSQLTDDAQETSMGGTAQHEVAPIICTKLVSRLKAMICKLLPLQVEDEDITAANGSILTPEAIKAFYLAGGDFKQAVPYCLLVASSLFAKDAYRNPSDYDEHMNHKLACEVAARRVVAKFPVEEQYQILSTRFSRIESDGDVSLPLSAIELASDLHLPIFLSSAESQKTIFALWKGHLVQERDEKGHVVYKIWQKMGGLDPSRLAVPRYQNVLRILLWILFLVCYTLAIQTPDREFGLEDYIFYIQVAGYTLEEIVRFSKIRSLAAINFWTIVSLSIYTLAFVALGLRIADLASHDDKQAVGYRREAFKVLSCAAPLVWAKLTTVFDLFTFFGSMQIVVGRMMKESAIFFALLAILSMGFLQALTGLDFADESRDATSTIIHSLLQGLLGSPDFETYADEGLSYPYGMILYYAWTILTIVILLNILIALFGTSYSNVADDAIAQYMAFFAQKTISAVRAPDQFVYVAPFNLIELPLLPLELCLSKDVYARINRWLLTILFFPVLLAISIFESRFAEHRNRHKIHASLEQEDYDEDFDEDPSVDDDSEGVISKIPFADLVKAFPDIQTSTTAQILNEVKQLKKELEEVKKQVAERAVKKEED